MSTRSVGRPNSDRSVPMGTPAGTYLGWANPFPAKTERISDGLTLFPVRPSGGRDCHLQLELGVNRVDQRIHLRTW